MAKAVDACIFCDSIPCVCNTKPKKVVVRKAVSQPTKNAVKPRDVWEEPAAHIAMKQAASAADQSQAEIDKAIRVLKQSGLLPHQVTPAGVAWRNRRN